MAIVYKYSRPSIFIMFTANTKWDKVICKLQPKQTAINRPNLVMRTFCMKLNHFLHNLNQKQILGQYCGCVWTIEYQKRGLPLFLHLHDYIRLVDPAVINRFIFVGFSQPEDDPICCFTEIVKSMIVYSL